jgi:predicted anti-sigma-YlaC factor YlaD
MQVLAETGVISETAATNSTKFGLLIACVAWAVLLTVVTRGRSGYQRYRDEAEQLDLDHQRAAASSSGPDYGS